MSKLGYADPLEDEPEPDEDDTKKLAKLEGDTSLLKADLTAANEALASVTTERDELKKVAGELQESTAELLTLLAKKAPATRAIDKASDSGIVPAEETELQKLEQSDDPLDAIRATLRKGSTFLNPSR